MILSTLCILWAFFPFPVNSHHQDAGAFFSRESLATPLFATIALLFGATQINRKHVMMSPILFTKKNRFAGELVTNHKAIACHYFKTWFLPDFAVFGPQKISIGPVGGNSIFFWIIFTPRKFGGFHGSNLRFLPYFESNGLVGE